MSFRSIGRGLRQPQRSFAARHVAFRMCLQSYCYFCRQSHQAIYDRFSSEFGFDEKVPDANERLLRALDALEDERAQKLEYMRAFDMKRVRAKMRGRRTLSKVEQTALETIRRGD